MQDGYGPTRVAQPAHDPSTAVVQGPHQHHIVREVRPQQLAAAPGGYDPRAVQQQQPRQQPLLQVAASYPDIMVFLVSADLYLSLYKFCLSVSLWLLSFSLCLLLSLFLCGFMCISLFVYLSLAHYISSVYIFISLSFPQTKQPPTYIFFKESTNLFLIPRLLV